MKDSAASMGKIPPTVVIHKHVDGADTIFSTMPGPLVKNTLGKWLEVIIIGTYQEASEYSRWAYETMSDLWPDIDPDSYSSYDGSSYEEIKYHDNPDYQEH